MFASLLILLTLPILDVSRIRAAQFRPLFHFTLLFFFVDVILLGVVGASHPETPWLEIGQVATALYFIYFLILVPVIGLFENTIMDIATPHSDFNSFNLKFYPNPLNIIKQESKLPYQNNINRS